MRAAAATDDTQALVSSLGPPMKFNRFRWWWVFGNIVWFFAVPMVFAAWLSAEIDGQYKSGVRTATDGDSLSIPVAVLVVLNGLLLLVANTAVGIVLITRKVRGRFTNSSVH
ncbi:MAG: hypothetical protein CFE44_14355 [Burkholderiales bacterium PBB4]|nr:MAG: hypothetical protein CFE44_14355 [Burkholderiales bacterium PBB4]